MFMKTFEEKWTAWLDGQLKGKELVEFEASLPDRTEAEAEKHETQKLSAFLKYHIAERTMGNQEFFNHQLISQLKAEAAKTTGADRAPSLRPAWSIRRLVWVGATSLALFLICTFFV